MSRRPDTANAESVNDRRIRKRSADTIDHAIELVTTHGTAYASRYLKNHRIGEETIARVISGTAVLRQVKPPTGIAGPRWTDVDRGQRMPEPRELSYKLRSKIPPSRRGY